MLCDEHGNELCDGVSEREVANLAQDTADRLGITVYAHRSDADADPEQEPEAFEPG